LKANLQNCSQTCANKNAEESGEKMGSDETRTPSRPKQRNARHQFILTYRATVLLYGDFMAIRKIAYPVRQGAK
jgi:hypothetical protein